MFESLKKLVSGTPEQVESRLVNIPAEQIPTTLIRAEPIVDRQGQLVGSLVRRRLNQHIGVDHDRVILDAGLFQAFQRLVSATKTPRPWMLEMSCESIFLPDMDQLAEEGTTLLLLPGVMPEGGEDRLGSLCADGLRLTLNMPGDWPERTIALAAGFGFSMHGRPREHAESMIHRIFHLAPKATMVAVDIANQQEYEWILRSGCHFAVGQLFRKQELPDEPVDAGFVRVLDVLNLVRKEAAPADIAAAVRTDALLALRLLQQINSAAFGLGRKVESLEQAVIVLGRDSLYRWLSLLLYSHPGASGKSQVLQEMAQLRGELMQRLGQSLKGQSESLYLTGIFSMLDALLNRPMARILEKVELPDPVREALLNDKGPYAAYLRLTRAAELPEQPDIALLDACGLDSEAYNRCLVDAMAAVKPIEHSGHEES